MFGYGMALAGNCGFGALARLGGGDLRSFVIVLVMGVAAYATLSGPLVYARLWAQDATSVASASTGYAGLISTSIGMCLCLKSLSPLAMYCCDLTRAILVGVRNNE